MTKLIVRLRAAALLTIVIAAAPSAHAAAAPATFGRPIFVGAAPVARSLDLNRHHGLLGFMTAAEMKDRLASITGYEHPAFDLFADVIGRYDPTSGARTNDRPTLVTILFLKRIASEIAAAVLAREAFLDDAERIDFRGVDFAAAVDDASLDLIDRSFFSAWLGYEAGTEELASLRAAFHAAYAVTAGDDTEKNVAGYTALLALALQNGGLYYY